MKTDTQQKMYYYISKNQGIRAKNIITYLSLNPTGIFKHLKIMQDQQKIYKIGKPPKVRYYTYVPPMENKYQPMTDAINWAVSGDTRLAPPDILCQTRDVFQARLNRLLSDLAKELKNDNLVYLIVAIAGEIGNNSFDHNMGHWQDTPGVVLRVDVKTRCIILADRGQGVFATIKKVRPSVENDAAALKIAFTEILSGRAPEKRGNGLKFVKKIIEEKGLHLKFYTGESLAEITNTGMTIQKTDIRIPGTLVCLQF